MKRYNGKPRGRVNMGGATHEKDRERLKKLGKNYNSIDFLMTDQMNESNYSDRSIPIGTLEVGNVSIDLTWSECSKIMETLETAQQTHRQKIRLGLF
jgi:hypothetical protein